MYVSFHVCIEICEDVKRVRIVQETKQSPSATCLFICFVHLILQETDKQLQYQQLGQRVQLWAGIVILTREREREKEREKERESVCICLNARRV